MSYFYGIWNRLQVYLLALCRGVYGVWLRSSVFARRACVYSKIFHDIPLMGPNAILKNSNNVVNSSPRVLIFSGIIVPINLIRYIRSRDHAHFRFGRQGVPNFFSNSIFSATVRAISEIFSGSCAHWRALLKFRGTWGSGVKFGARPPKWKFIFFIVMQCLQCFDAVGWAAGRASSL